VGDEEEQEGITPQTGSETIGRFIEKDIVCETVGVPNEI